MDNRDEMGVPDGQQLGPPRNTSSSLAQGLGAVCSVDLYAAALDQAAIVAATDVKGTIVYANEQFCKLSKYSHSELIGANHRILKSGHHPRTFFKDMYRTVARGEVWRGEIKNRAKDGSTYWVDTTVVPTKDTCGKVHGYISIRIDITRRKLAEEENVRDLSEMGSDWVWEQDAELRFREIGSGIGNANVQASSLIGKRRWELPIECDADAMAQHRALLEARQPFRDFEYKYLGAGGPDQAEWFSISGRPLFDAEGRFTGYRGVGKCITARVRAEEALRKRTSQLQAIIDNFPGGIALVDREMRVALANDKAHEVLGIPQSLFANGPPLLEDLFRFNASRGEYGPGDVEEQVAKRTALARQRQPHVFARERPDGTVLEVRGVPIAEGGFVTTYTDITERQRLNAELEQSNKRYERLTEQLVHQTLQLDTALENMAQGLCLFDAEQRIVICNSRYADMYGLTPEQVKPGTSIRQIMEYRYANGVFGDVDFETFVREWLAEFGKASSRIQKLADGRVISAVRRLMPDGGLVTTHEDITEREKLNAQLEQQHQLLQQQDLQLRVQNLQLDAALSNMAQGLAMFDAERRLVLCNARFADMYGLRPEQVKPGTTLRQIVEYRIANGDFPGRSADEVMDPLLLHLDGTDAGYYTTWLSNDRCLAVSVQPMADGGSVSTHQDITEQQRAEAKIAHMALHDALTGLPNRVLLNERLQHALARAKRGEVIATHLLDLDHFKNVNDTLGHAAGDKLLKMVTERLRGLTREADTIARMGGDEFAVLQVAIALPSDATALAQRLIDAISAPYDIDGHQVIIGTSVGIAVGPLDGDDPHQLIRNADLALYGAKGEGRGTYRFFEPEMHAQMQTRRAMECDLRKALAAGEFELHYQPIVNLENDEIVGFEALVRWHHPERGMVPPGAFMPLAEDIGFIVPLGEWVLRTACAAAAKWPRDLKVAVNLSPAQFRNPGLIQVVVGAVAASGLSPSRLELEITETVLLEDKETTLAVLNQLHELGIGVAMDDFGTGYSSLSYLQSFPFDRIKIDQSFVNDINESATSLNIVRAVAALAKGLRMPSTAEGVETKAQMDIVKSEGCTEMQGFYFSQPRPLREIEQLFLSQHTQRKTDAADAA